ncbi:MAG: hypothetical protein ACP6IY_01785 [Promethearchaeia archaeon]
MAKKKEVGKKSTSVLTIRVDNDLDKEIEEISNNLRITKAELFRNYLNMAKYIQIDRGSIKSMNQNDLIIIKRNFFYDIISNLDEVSQIELGEELARYINDLARIKGKDNDIEFKLDMCEHFGFFKKFIDNDNYILFSKQFGPKKFVESFAWYLITNGFQGDFDKAWIESEIEKSSKIRDKYNSTIKPIHRDSDHYSFEYANLDKINKKKK